MTTNAGSGTVSVTKRIAAPAAEIFGVLTNPIQHPGIDGSGMVRDGSGNPTVSGVGDVFRMQMHHDEWGSYQMDNHVTTFEKDHQISWEPRPVVDPAVPDDKVPGYYVWGYVLEADGEATVVTEFFDCTRSPQWLRDATCEGEAWREAMSETLGRLENRCVAERAAAGGTH